MEYKREKIHKLEIRVSRKLNLQMKGILERQNRENNQLNS